jgi:hypothetical protein
VRPEKPEAFYRTAVVLADQGSPRVASNYAAVYLRLQPTPLRSRFKTDNAVRVKQGSKPDPDPELMQVKPLPIGPDTDIGPTEPETVEIEVPNFIGADAKIATSRLSRMGLVPRLFPRADCEASNKVVSLDPQPGKRAARGSEISVLVSVAGKDSEPVPNLNSMPLKDAEAILRKHQFRLRVGRRLPQTDMPANIVQNQDPLPPKLLKHGCEVVVDISAPLEEDEDPNMVEVPVLIGLSRNDALRAIKNAFLKAQIVEGDSEYGAVYDQDPKPGTRVPKGTVVKLSFPIGEMSLLLTISPRSLVGKNLRE